MNERERIEFLVTKLARGNQAEFARQTGISTTSLCKIGKSLKLSEHYIRLIISSYPAVNAQFLRDGESYAGNIDNESTIAEYASKIKDLERKIKSLEKDNARLTKIIDKMLS